MKWSNNRIVNEVRKIANEIDYPVPEVQISNRMSKRFGKTDPISKVLRINKRFIELNSFSIIRALIIHELVHLEYPNHGSGFKSKMNKFGYGSHIFKKLSTKIEKYRYECDNCGVIYDNRKLNGAVCKKCGSMVKEKGKEVVNLRPQIF